ncbi:MAG: arcadin 1 [Nitrososphaerota archaeon]|nr:arcadin 1 [Nitrososphaerota archaeon]
MVLVKVNRGSSYTDPETGKPGKQVELVEVRRRQQPRQPFGEEAQMIQGIMSQLQGFGIMMPQGRDMVMPKVTMIISENEYDLLQVRFEVNDMYELTMKGGSITFTKATEPYA